MSSAAGNPNPWPPYDDDYKDCSHGLCSVYCPQWCYAIYPPPPPFPFLEDNDDGSSTDFSPLLIALVGILAGAFILLAYYAFISKLCRRRRGGSGVGGESNWNAGQSVTVTWQGNDRLTAGLDEALIKSITIYRYKKSERFVDCSDCSVCLSEFEEDERLRLLPKCNHAFHVPCIDMWLMSHSNCPLCRADIAASNQPIETSQEPAADDLSTEIDISTLEHHHRSDESVVVIRDPDSESHDETAVTIDDDEGDGDETQQIRGSAPPNSPPCNVTVSVADILRQIEDDDEEWIGVGSSMQREGTEKRNQRNGMCSFLNRNLPATKRFVSTERIARHDRGRNCELAN